MARSAKILPNYTYLEYANWQGRWEVIDGIPHSMTPMPSPEHQAISGRIHAAFLQSIAESGCSHCTVYQPIDLKISEHTVVNPDILIVCKPIAGQYLDFPPELVVEILSPSTELKDRHTKFELYQEFGIQYYLIIDPKSKSVEWYHLNSVGKFDLLLEPTSISLGQECNISPILDSIWS